MFRRESELALQLREAESRFADQARRRERAEREAAELKESSKKVRQALEGEEKAARGLRWELEDRQQIAAAEVIDDFVSFFFGFGDDWKLLVWFRLLVRVSTFVLVY